MNRRIQRIAEDSPIPNRSAADRRLLPSRGGDRGENNVIAHVRNRVDASEKLVESGRRESTALDLLGNEEARDLARDDRLRGAVYLDTPDDLRVRSALN
jgi:hypothetical protein